MVHNERFGAFNSSLTSKIRTNQFLMILKPLAFFAQAHERIFVEGGLKTTGI